MKKLIVAFLLFASYISNAQNPVDWKILGESGNGDSYFQQFTHKKVGDNLIDVWDRTNIKKYVQKGKAKALLGTYSISLKRYDCSERKIRNLQFTLYDSKGSVIINDNSYEDFEYAIPGSAGELLLDNACKMIGK